MSRLRSDLAPASGSQGAVIPGQDCFFELHREKRPVSDLADSVQFVGTARALEDMDAAIDAEIGLDTSVGRRLTEDDPGQGSLATMVFDRLREEAPGYVAAVVGAETYWVLTARMGSGGTRSSIG